MRNFLLGCLALPVALVLILIGLGVLVNAAQKPPAMALSAPALKAPTVVGRWSSKGDLTTPPFVLQGSQARVDFDISPPKAGGPAQVCLYLKQADGTHVRADCLKGTGQTQLYVKPGSYYLEMHAVSDDWTITVTDLP